MRRKSTLFALAALFGLAACQASNNNMPPTQSDANLCGTPDVPPQHTYTIGTGDLTDISYPIGGAVQRFVNEGRDTHGIRLSVESRGNSAANLTAVASGDLDFGFVAADTYLDGGPEVLSLFTVRQVPTAFETVVVSRDVPDYVACETVKAVFGNLDAFRRYHPALTRLDAETMVDEVFVAPLHPGALRYFDAVAVPVPDRLRARQ